jgi:hypothetical protein
VRRDKPDRDFATGQTHGEVLYATAVGEKFCLARKFETGFSHARFVDRTGDDGVQFSVPRQGHRFFERGRRSPRSFKRWLGRFALRWPSDDNIISRLGHAPAGESEINNLRADPGAIAECDADPNFPALAHDCVLAIEQEDEPGQEKDEDEDWEEEPNGKRPTPKTECRTLKEEFRKF